MILLGICTGNFGICLSRACGPGLYDGLGAHAIRAIMPDLELPYWVIFLHECLPGELFRDSDFLRSN